jgi:cysteine desulfurase
MLHVNNETGITHPIDLLKYEIRNSLYHVDAVQSLGKLSIDLRHINCDYFTMSGHKFGTPKGIACLWVKDNVPLNIPYLGTPPIPLISAFAKTLVSIDPKRNYRELLKKEIYLTETLQNYASLNNIEFDYNVFSGDRIPGILSIKFKGIDSSELLLTLIDKKIAISTGSACNSDEIAPSHVLIAMNISLKDVMSTVRISLSAESKYDEIKKGINILINTIREMKNERSELTKNY